MAIDQLNVALVHYSSRIIIIQECNSHDPGIHVERLIIRRQEVTDKDSIFALA